MDFVEIGNVYVGKIIIKAAKRIFNSVKKCCSHSGLNFGVTFLEHSVPNVQGPNVPFWGGTFVILTYRFFYVGPSVDLKCLLTPYKVNK